MSRPRDRAQVGRPKAGRWGQPQTAEPGAALGGAGAAVPVANPRDWGGRGLRASAGTPVLSGAMRDASHAARGTADDKPPQGEPSRGRRGEGGRSRRGLRGPGRRAQGSGRSQALLTSEHVKRGLLGGQQAWPATSFPFLRPLLLTVGGGGRGKPVLALCRPLPCSTPWGRQPLFSATAGPLPRRLCL